MKPVLRFFSEKEVEKVHQTSLEILAELGMRMPLKEALQMMERAGATVTGNDIVRIPPRLIHEAIEKAPKRKDVVLYGRDPRNDVRFEGHDPAIASMTMATHVIDPHTRKRRLATNDDLEKLTRLADELEIGRAHV